MAPKTNGKDSNKQKTLLGFFSKVQGPAASPKPSNPNSNSNSNANASTTSSSSSASTSKKNASRSSNFSPVSSSGASPASISQPPRSLPLETPPTSVGRGEASSKNKSSSAKGSKASSDERSKSQGHDSEMEEDNVDPPSSSPAMPSPTTSRQKAATLKPNSKAQAPGSGRMASNNDDDEDDDEEDEQDEMPVTQRRAVKKRPSTYVESASEDGDDSDADAFKPAKKSTSKKPLSKRRKAEDDGDDFIVADEDMSEVASVALSVEQEESEEEAPIASKSKKGKGAARDSTSPIQGFKSGSSPAATSSARPTLSSARPSSNSHLTKAERRVQDEKRKRQENEQAYSFLVDLRDKDGNRVDSPKYDPRTVYVPKSAWNDFTPFEKQFWEIKQNHWDTVLFFQKGKFYELYEEDALIGHREFDLKLTDRVKMKMVGVPESSFEIFAAKFLALGYKVGRVDQVETAVAKDMRLGGEKKKAGQDIVRRELRHVLTGGTIVDAGALADDLNSYCLSIKESLEGSGERTIPTFGICSLDASTAEFNLTWFQDDESRTKLETLLRSLRLKELIHEKGGLSAQTLRVLRNTVPQSCQTTMLKPGTEFLDEEDTLKRLNILFSKEAPEEGDESMDIDGVEPARADQLPQAISSMLDKSEAVSALGGLLWYLSQLNLDRDLCSSRNFNIFDPIRQSKCLILDAQSLTHLNVLSNEQDTEEGTLHRLLNRCVTPFGKRLFKVWLVAPLATAAAITARQDAVDDFLKSDDFSDAFSKFAKKLPDIERIIPRIVAGKCKPADFTKVLNAFARFNASVETLVSHTEGFTSQTIGKLLRSIPNVTEKAKIMQGKFIEDEKDGSWIPREDVNEAFDEAENGLKSVEQALEDELVQYRKDLGLSKNSIKFKHIGTKDIYQVEVPRGTKVPKNWIQMSATKKELRFYSPEIKSLVQQLKEARETRLAALKKFHSELFSEFADNSPLYLAAVKTVAEIDCLLSLAKASEAMGQPACRPEILDSDVALVDFEELRHPCMGLGSRKDFIPNSVKLGGDNDEVIILTGGNMAGKSTTARTTATAVILAQLGCRVPAASARIAPVDRIASRMGANDQIFRNNSTFMVEMLEASRILRECTPRSLVIMDELGRGTSTFDGQSIAFAVLHHLIGRTRCLAFFLTHYTSLARDFNSYPRVSNKHMEVIVDDLEVLFTYRLVDGIAESSYGTQVAALAGVPSEICLRASEVSQQFMEASEAQQAERVQNRIPVATLADFTRLVEISQNSDEELSDEELAFLGSQCQVIAAQVKALAALEPTPVASSSAASAEAADATLARNSASERSNAPAKMISYGRKGKINQLPDESISSLTPSSLEGESDSPLHRSQSGPTPNSTFSESNKRKREEALSSPSRSKSLVERGASNRSSDKRRSNKPQEQLILDFGQKLRMTCKECDMSYDRSSPDDVSIHSKHHERMTKGVDWSAKTLYNPNFMEVLSTFSIGKEGLKKLSGNGVGKLGVDPQVKILRYDLGMNLDSVLARKIDEVLTSIDSALGAASLPQEALKSTKLYIAVGPNQRLVGAVLVGRVKVGTARRVVPPSENGEVDQGTLALHDSSGGDAIFVSSPLPSSQTPPLAVHRIHVLPCLRRFGIGSTLLDSVLSNGVYGIGASELAKMHGGRLGVIAFSQPTMAGRNLAERWGRIGLKDGEGQGLVVFEE